MTQSCQISQKSIHRHFYWATRFVRQVCDFNRWNLLFPPLKMDHIHLTKKKVEISRQTFSWFLSCQHYRTEPSTRVCVVLQPAFTKFKFSISNHFILTSQTIETEYLASETVISWEPGLTRLTSSLHTHSHTKKGKKNQWNFRVRRLVRESDHWARQWKFHTFLLLPNIIYGPKTVNELAFVKII